MAWVFCDSPTVTKTKTASWHREVRVTFEIINKRQRNKRGTCLWSDSSLLTQKGLRKWGAENPLPFLQGEGSLPTTQEPWASQAAWSAAAETDLVPGPCSWCLCWPDQGSSPWCVSSNPLKQSHTACRCPGVTQTDIDLVSLKWVSGICIKPEPQIDLAPYLEAEKFIDNATWRAFPELLTHPACQSTTWNLAFGGFTDFFLIDNYM